MQISFTWIVSIDEGVLLECYYMLWVGGQWHISLAYAWDLDSILFPGVFLFTTKRP